MNDSMNHERPKPTKVPAQKHTAKYCSIIIIKQMLQNIEILFFVKTAQLSMDLFQSHPN